MMMFEYRIGNLKKYAQLHGKTANELRDSILDHLVSCGVHYADKADCCPREDIITLIKAFEDGDAVVIETAKSQAEKLNRDELSDLLTDVVKRTYYTLGCKAWVRYANEESVQKACEKHIHMSKGNAAPDEIGRRFYHELVHSDTRAAMQMFDKYGDLDLYAQQRGMSAMEVRDSMMLPAFDFDADDVKRYDIGGNTIEVSIAPDLSFRLFDVNKQKEIRSFPKKSDDPAKAEACAKEFAAFKKEVLAFAKQRTELLHKMHMSGEYVRADLWRKVYVEHPVIAKLAKLVVWQDEARKTFMVADDGTIDSQSNAYVPQGKIRVAHVLNMEPTDITAWQQWLAKRGCVQLFEQVWEPVIRYDAKDIANRYKGATLTNEERNAVKKALKLRGVDMRAAEMDREYNHRAGEWVFSNKGTMLFGDCLRVDYTVDEKTKAITFGKASADVFSTKREMNAVLLEMDKATLSAQITRDNEAALTDQALSVFSAAQTAGLLNLAIDHKATRCTACLLDYKNAHFPEFVDVNEFSLDW